MPELQVIDKFDGEYRFLSNFYTCSVIYDGYSYASAEHAYQAAKSLSHRQRLLIASQSTPGQAKRMGGNVELRPAWNKKRMTIMHKIVSKKFEMNTPIRQRLLKTSGALLIEGNNWGDTFWGCVKKDGEWFGDNNLGIVLMMVRQELQ